jgi:hypothetical protein
MPEETVIERARKIKSKASQRAPRLANLSAKRWSTFGRKARGAVAAAGDCHRAFEGQTRGRCVSRFERRIGENAGAGSSRHGKRVKGCRGKALQGALAGNFCGTEEREDPRRRTRVYRGRPGLRRSGAAVTPGTDPL